MEVIKADKNATYVPNEFELAVAEIDKIETMPGVAQKLIKLTSDPDFNMAQLHDLVQSDPVIAAKILRVASSTFYGSRPATNLRSALIRIGMRDLRKLVMASSMIGGKVSAFNQTLWTYSLRVASISEAIAELVRTKDLDDPFLCGLLHDFGTVVMNKVLGKPYREALGEPCKKDQDKVEVEHFGFDHCDLGVMVAQHWKLFEALEHVMQHHHEPARVEELGLAESSQVAVYVVALARQVALEPSEGSEELVAELCERLALTDDELLTCKINGLERYDDMYSGLLPSPT